MVLIRGGRPLAMTACKVPMIKRVLDTQTGFWATGVASFSAHILTEFPTLIAPTFSARPYVVQVWAKIGIS